MREKPDFMAIDGVFGSVCLISELNLRLTEPWSKTSVVATAINGMMLTVAVVGVQGLTAVGTIAALA